MSEFKEKHKELFQHESAELIREANNLLLILEKNPDQIENFHEIFRIAHTLKGMSATIGNTQMEETLQLTEDILALCKENKESKEMMTQYQSVLFRAFDALESMITQDLSIPLFDVLKQELRGKEIQDFSKDYSGEQKVVRVGVPTYRLDHLMNLTKELFINKIQIDTLKEKYSDKDFNHVIDRFERNLFDLQYSLLQTRLIPFNLTTSRFPRMVRDLALKQNKDVHFKIEGGDIEIDRVVGEELGKALVHLTRNAIDHGIEVKENRLKNGKSAWGNITLSAEQQREMIVISLKDDGQGLDIEKIKQKAVETGFASHLLSDTEAIGAIFSALSTRDEVSTVSGRGYGLNSVKETVEGLNGTISVKSESGKGTVFTLEIPISTVITRILFVEVGSQLFGIPFSYINRILDIKNTEIQTVLGKEAIIIEETEAFLVRLSDMFHINHEKKKKSQEVVVLVNFNDKKMGLVVDTIVRAEEVVTMPPTLGIKEHHAFCGCTIVGTGDVVLLIDVANLLNKTIKKTEKVNYGQSISKS